MELLENLLQWGRFLGCRCDGTERDGLEGRVELACLARLGENVTLAGDALETFAVPLSCALVAEEVRVDGVADCNVSWLPSRTLMLFGSPVWLRVLVLSFDFVVEQVPPEPEGQEEEDGTEDQVSRAASEVEEFVVRVVLGPVVEPLVPGGVVIGRVDESHVDVSVLCLSLEVGETRKWSTLRIEYLPVLLSQIK